MTYLTEPDIRYEAAFREAIANYHAVGETKNAAYYEAALSDFGAYVQELKDFASGVNLPENWVPGATYWLTNDAGEVLGMVRLRYEYIPLGHIGYDIVPCHRQKGYGTRILKLALEKARARNMDSVVVACDDDNVPSMKIIEKNGGQFWDVIRDDVDQTDVRRYKIQL